MAHSPIFDNCENIPASGSWKKATKNEFDSVNESDTMYFDDKLKTNVTPKNNDTNKPFCVRYAENKSKVMNMDNVANLLIEISNMLQSPKTSNPDELRAAILRKQKLESELRKWKDENDKNSENNKRDPSNLFVTDPLGCLNIPRTWPKVDPFVKDERLEGSITVIMLEHS